LDIWHESSSVNKGVTGGAENAGHENAAEKDVPVVSKEITLQCSVQLFT